MSILEDMSEKMKDIKANPEVTPYEVGGGPND